MLKSQMTSKEIARSFNDTQAFNHRNSDQGRDASTPASISSAGKEIFRARSFEEFEAALEFMSKD